MEKAKKSTAGNTTNATADPDHNTNTKTQLHSKAKSHFSRRGDRSASNKENGDDGTRNTAVNKRIRQHFKPPIPKFNVKSNSKANSKQDGSTKCYPSNNNAQSGGSTGTKLKLNTKPASTKSDNEKTNTVNNNTNTNKSSESNLNLNQKRDSLMAHLGRHGGCVTANDL